MASRIFLVEDHPVMREGYAVLLDAEPDLEVVAEASSAEEAFEVSADLDYDLAVVDLSLPGTNGLELIKRLRSLDPDVKVLVVSAHDEALYAERAIRAGARGYLMKNETARQFVTAVRTVLDGELYVSESLRSRLLENRFAHASEPTPAISRLTDRQLEVFEHFGRGLSTREVAEAMGIGLKTVESHRANMKGKLGVETAAEFARRAVLWVESPAASDPAAE